MNHNKDYNRCTLMEILKRRASLSVLSISLCISMYLSVSVCIYLSGLSVYQYLSVWSVCVCLSICICLSVSICLSVYKMGILLHFSNDELSIDFYKQEKEVSEERKKPDQRF